VDRRRRPPGRLLNRVLLPLLRHPAGRRLGRRLAVLEYDGRRTGQRRRLVAAYTRTGQRVTITVGQPESKTWWRNFLTPYRLRLRLAGEELDGMAHVEPEADAVHVLVDLGTPDQERSSTAS
jgi:hypothetical protein